MAVGKSLLLLSITIIYFFFISKLFAIFFADVFLVHSKQQLEKGDVYRALESINTSLSNNNNEPAYFRQKAKIEAYLGETQSAYQTLQTAKNLNPKNLATLRNSVPTYYLLAKNSQNTETTATYYSNLKSTYPNDLGIYADIALYEKKLGLEKNFAESVQKAGQLRSDILEWHPSFN